MPCAIRLARVQLARHSRQVPTLGGADKGADAIALGRRCLSWLGRGADCSVCFDVLEKAARLVPLVRLVGTGSHFPRHEAVDPASGQFHREPPRSYSTGGAR